MKIFLCSALLLGSFVQVKCFSAGNASKPEPVNLSYSCMRVTSEGTSEGAPVVLIHGVGFTKEVWSGVFQLIALKTRRRVCVVDLRNHGRSPYSDVADVGAMAEDIRHLLDTLGIERAAMLGHSLGGKIAVHLTLNYPERVDRLIVEDMRPNGLTDRALLEVKGFLGIITIALKQIPKGSTEKQAKLFMIDYLNKFLKSLGSKMLLDERSADILPLKCSEGDCRWDVNMAVLMKVLKDPLSYLTESKGIYIGPALFIYGKNSPFQIWADEENIKRLFPRARLVGVEGAAHVVHDRKEFLDNVVSFLNQDST